MGDWKHDVSVSGADRMSKKAPTDAASATEGEVIYYLP